MSGKIVEFKGKKLNKRAKPMARLDYLDMLKGFGMILVVLAHSGRLPENVTDWIVSFHMPLFFVVSGYIIAMKRSWQEGFLSFLGKRLRGLMIPYFAFSIVYLTIYLYFFVRYPGALEAYFFYDSFIAIFTGYGFSVLWFFTALFWAEIFYYLILRGFHSLPGGHSIVKGLAGVLILALMGWIPVQAIDAINGAFPKGFSYGSDTARDFLMVLARIPATLVFLFAGSLLWTLINRQLPGRGRSSGRTLVEVIFAICCMILHRAIQLANVRVDLHFLVFGRPLFFYLGAIAASYGLVLIFRHLPGLWLLKVFGRNSVILMVTHLDGQMISFAMLISRLTIYYVETGRILAYNLAFFVFLLLAELFWIPVINRWFYLLLGKKKRGALWGP